MIKKFKIFESSKKKHDVDPYGEENWNDDKLYFAHDEENMIYCLFVSKKYLKNNWEFDEIVANNIKDEFYDAEPEHSPYNLPLFFRIVDSGDSMEFDHGWVMLKDDKAKIMQWG